jgi:catechol 2,3-dioxygenase-like lactoylglutathione lyase family enzyme
MPKKPSIVAPVSELQTSVDFYRTVLQLEVADTGSDAAIVNPEGMSLLLTGPDAEDLTPLVADPHEILRPGATIHQFSPDVSTLQEHLSILDVDARLDETSWGDRTLTITDPDGYPVCFWTHPNRTVQQTLELYASGPNALEAAIAGLDDEQMGWKPSPDDWSIREIIHHVTDSDATALFRVKMALAEPGRVMLGNPYHPDTWARSLDYNARDVAPSLALLRATRRHILQIIDHLPDAMDRTIRNPEGQETNVETFISMLASHLMLHIDQIEEVKAGITTRS